MWLGINSLATLLLLALPALADSCIFSASPLFNSSDAVDWTMQIASGRSCTRGLKLGSMNISDVKLIAPPQSGQVAIKDFQGEDDFTLRVSGTLVRMRGVSDVKVTVSVVSK
jgi:hypothetical protein